MSISRPNHIHMILITFFIMLYECIPINSSELQCSTLRGGIDMAKVAVGKSWIFHKRLANFRHLFFKFSITG